MPQNIAQESSSQISLPFLSQGGDVMNVTFIGGGRAGTSFAKVLQKTKEFTIKAVTALTVKEAENSSKFIGNVQYAGTDNIKAIDYSEVIFITTPDDIIKKIADDISQAANLKGKFVFHISGSLSSDILEECRKNGAFAGSIHPLQSMPSFEQGSENIKKAYFCIEGDANAVNVGKTIVQAINNQYFTINSELKGLYHAAAVFASNYINTTCFAAYSIFRKLGIEEDKILEIIKPLIKGTVNNIEQLGFIQSLTGPISRGDLNTIKNHLNSFINYDTEHLSLYKELGKETVKLALEKEKANKNKFLTIKNILEE